MARRISAPKADAAQVLRTLEGLQAKHDITIIKLSEPVSSAYTEAQNAEKARLAADGSQAQQQRTSDVSASSALDLPTPASLEADLAHYRELFAKLRFSYVEQVTKEKFIRAIVGEPPLIVGAQDNADLEAANAAAKAELKVLKAEVADMVADLEARGRALAARHARVQLDTAALRDVPARAAQLEADIARLRAERQQQEGGEELGLPLSQTALLVDERRAKVAELDRALEQLGVQVPRKRKELERLQAELGPLDAKRANSTAAAKEARRRKEAALGGVEDDLEERGRWWRVSEAALKQMLDIN